MTREIAATMHVANGLITRISSASLILMFAVGCSTTSGTGSSLAGEPVEDPAFLTSAEVHKDPDRIICRRHKPTGSRISEKICMTARQWYDQSEYARRGLDQAQRAPRGGDGNNGG